MSGDNPKEGPVQAAAKPLRSVPAPSSDLEWLFRAHSDRVFRVAYRITGSAADAEDVLQTVFLRLAGSSERGFADNPEAYLSRAAINAALDVLRRRSRVRTVELEEAGAELLAVKTPNPESEQVDRELKGLIRAAVSRLGATAAEMFVLRYYEGHDNREIARRMGTSQLVVGVVLHRARTRLRKEIGHYLEKHHEKR